VQTQSALGASSRPQSPVALMKGGGGSAGLESAARAPMATQRCSQGLKGAAKPLPACCGMRTQSSSCRALAFSPHRATCVWQPSSGCQSGYLVALWQRCAQLLPDSTVHCTAPRLLAHQLLRHLQGFNGREASMQLSLWVRYEELAVLPASSLCLQFSIPVLTTCCPFARHACATNAHCTLHHKCIPAHCASLIARLVGFAHPHTAPAHVWGRTGFVEGGCTPIWCTQGEC